MDRLPFRYVRLRALYRLYDKFKAYDDKYCAGLLGDNEVYDFFISMRTFYTYYWKFIKNDYRDDGIFIKLPLDVIKRAEADGRIHNGDFLRLFIAGNNAQAQATSKKEKFEVTKKIIERCHEGMYTLLDYIKGEEMTKFYEDLADVAKLQSEREIKMSDIRPVYSHEELKITKRSYNLIMNTFKKFPSVKNVWMHGSRYQGTSTPGSDIDIVIDCPEADFQKIKNKFQKLLIPYFVDPKCLYAPESRDFLQSVTAWGSKWIYCAKDFEIYWSPVTKAMPKPSINISKIVIDGAKKDIKEEKYYVRWWDFYRAIWQNIFLKFKSDFADMSEKDLIERYGELYECTYTIMRIFLANRGFFLDGMWMVIKYAYKAYLVEDGDDWIEHVAAVEAHKQSGDMEKLVDREYIEKTLHLYEKFNSKLISLMR